MWTFLLLAAALLAAYMGIRSNRQRAPQSRVADRDQLDETTPQMPANEEPKINLSTDSIIKPAGIRRMLAPTRTALTPWRGRNPWPGLEDYQFPTLDLLEPNAHESVVENNTDLERHKEQIVQTLRGFDIEVSRITATAGPAMTLYEIAPGPGVRIARIRHLEEELALALAAPEMRMIAPNPGKGTIGMEVPNAKRSIVNMREVLAADNFRESKITLPVAMGKNSSNTTFIFDLAAMPHLLLTGATGQGKSVGLHAMLISLLYKKRPSDVKFVLVDLNQIELSVYGLIGNHFLAGVENEAPIITDHRKALQALNALCIEMDNRYELLTSANTRNIKEYNEKFAHQQLSPDRGHQFLPLLVVVIDDVMDLIVTHGNEAKAPIIHLSEKGRAAGIHLILVTSRSLTENLAHDLLQNIPARASFRLGSRHDSRTILNTIGGEKLTHPGDMLLSFEYETTHLACAFAKPSEIEAVVQFIAAQKGYQEIYPFPEPAEQQYLEADSFDLEDRDPLLEEAARLIVTNQLGSTSLIQRKMKLGYNRAGRLMDQLEAIGVVGPAKGSQPREVLIKSEMELDQYLNP